MVEPAIERRAPAGHERVGVEERHGEVADVLGLECVHLRHDGADAGQPALAAQAGLGRAGGARGEEEVAERVGRHRSVGHRLGVGRGVRLERALRLVGVEHEHALVGRAHLAECVADARSLHQGQVGGVGDRGTGTRCGTGRAPARRRGAWGWRPTTTAPASAAASSQKTNSGTLSSMRATWKGPSLAPGLQPGRPRRRPGHHLGVAQPEVVGHQPEPVDVGQGQDGAGDGFGKRRRAGAGCGRLRLSRGHCISKRR